jgi:hypothetical protein
MKNSTQNLKLFKKEKREINVLIPRFYFFFAGAFFTSFLAGFLAINITSGINV